RLSFGFEFAVEAQNVCIAQISAMRGKNRANRRKNSTFPINQRAVAIKGDNSKIGSHNDLLFVVDILAFIHKYVNMRTTIELPDGLYRTLKARAGLSGTTVREVIHRLIEKG